MRNYNVSSNIIQTMNITQVISLMDIDWILISLTLRQKVTQKLDIDFFDEKQQFRSAAGLIGLMLHV